jgi:limonene-1,2-epoxide hydrolase
MNSNGARVIDRLVRATNAHDLEAVVACFAEDYRNVTPAHPHRSFTGPDQVRDNWRQIFAGVPDVQAAVTAQSTDGSRVWTEWRMSGTRRDGTAHDMVGVIVFSVEGDKICSARFYLEPVDDGGDTVGAHVLRQVHAERAPGGVST